MEQEVELFYEGVFLDNSEIEVLFQRIRQKTPLVKKTQRYHVTTEYRPSTRHDKFYGEKVLVHIESYKIEEVLDDDGKPTLNEGFKVSLHTQNSELQRYFDSLDKNFHITGTYESLAKYTEKISFINGKKMNVYVSGVFIGSNI